MVWLVATVLVGAVILFALYSYREVKKVRVLKHDIRVPHFPKSFGDVSLFFISDIQNQRISHHVVDEVKGKADLVVIGGNITKKGVPIERVSNNIETLREIGPIYFVWGEKDYEGDSHELDALLLDHKVTILDNTRAVFESESGDLLILLGVDDVSSKRDRLDLALSDSREDGFRILISHDASIVNKFTENEHISIVLSGHTQSNKIDNLPYHSSRFEGMYELEHTLLLASKGYSPVFVSEKLRFSSETHLITLHATR